ncbi:glycoside hydrolase family 97 protein [Marinilabilia rubra]|nr:glycoside hydrolase family 97 protein [Marinilabilia rubra]
MKYKLLILIVLCVAGAGRASAKQNNYRLSSPDKKIEIVVSTDSVIHFSVNFNGGELFSLSEIGMQLENEHLGGDPIVVKAKRQQVDETITPVVKIKEAEIINRFNELRLFFKKGFSLSFRVFNEGIAYRFETEKTGEITVLDEICNMRFPDNYMCWWGSERQFQSNNQVYYDYTSVQELGGEYLASLPLILKPSEGPKMVIAETDLQDYPGLWLKGANGLNLKSDLPKEVMDFKELSDRRLPITERYHYIAKTSGERSFPWRVFAIAEDDADLITNQMTYLLASENKIEDASWITPGKVSWDWWNANNVYNVDFKAGINTETYKYYIDFASEYGLEYVMLDEGWYKLGDLMEVVPEIDMEELTSYAKDKGVGLMLWCVWKTLDDQLEDAMDQFEAWGIKGIKVDFMDRDDKWMVNYFHRIASEAAKHKLMVDFHGSYKPAGIRRMYPNVMTREGVNGGEQFKWSMRQTPEHDLILPFGRMLAGPLDYTPGSMQNAQEKDFKPIFDTPMSMGTRCHQLAMFVVYESPVQMLCDSPTRYYDEPEFMAFLSDVPTVWDETVVLEARVSDKLLMARRNGKNWYLGGMIDWDERTVDVDLSFLPDGQKYKMTIYTDGVNANRHGNDFKMDEVIVDNSYKKTILLKKGGGMAAMLHPVLN